ncbi:hypothetical protein BK720_32175 [Bacillus thuringiensis serovar brasilensis]|nr:hypothetical protein BK720_32175 [Bacillus thuringiensis serovar brasilensis]
MRAFYWWQLLKEQQLKQILTTVLAGKGGIYEIKFLNVVSIWGHTGVIPGFDTFAGGAYVDGKLNSMGRAENIGLFKSILLVEYRR